MPLLSRDDYLATMGEHGTAVGPDGLPPADFWPYFDAIPESDLEGFEFSRDEVAHAWDTVPGQWQHVLIACSTRNVFLVIVLDVTEHRVLGHYVLDLNREYGVADQ